MKTVLRDHPKIYLQSPLESFLGISPQDPKGVEKSLTQVKKRDFARKEIVKLLYNYNQSLGNDAKALENIASLNDEKAYCSITGQQLGFMGGPAYTILKGISCVAWAKQYDLIPLFWLATEDHDTDEISQTFLLDMVGNLKKYRLGFPQKVFVEDLKITKEHLKTIKDFCKAVNQDLFFTSIAKETSFSKVMARLLVTLFQGTGLIFLEPYLFRSLAKNFFKKEISQATPIASIIEETTKNLVAAGGKKQLELTQGTNLFLKDAFGRRCKIQKANQAFIVGNKEFKTDELLKLIEESPERFSTNVAARCALQSSLLPIVANVAGPSEISYFHQLKDYFHYHGLSMPFLIPRVSATLIPQEAKKMLDRCGLKPWQPLPNRLTSLCPQLEEAVERIQKEWLESLTKEFESDFSKHLLKTWSRYFSKQLLKKVERMHLKQRGVETYALHYLNNLIHPHNRLQERVLNWLEFQSQTKENLVLELLESEQIKKPGHLFCYDF